MTSVLKGAIKFMQDDFKHHKYTFEKLKSHQNPHTLFIGCSDSRVLPNLITNSSVGELFIVRNIANIVPKYRISGDYVATTSAIEYALLALDIKNIVICGHSNCGGCKINIDKNNMPNTYKWLEQIAFIKNEVLQSLEENHILDMDLAALMIERANVIRSYENILTYPYVKERLREKKLNIHAWHYDIYSSEIYEYKNGIFELIGQNTNQNN